MNPSPVSLNPISREFPIRLITTTPANPSTQPAIFLPVIRSFRKTRQDNKIAIKFPSPVMIAPLTPDVCATLYKRKNTVLLSEPDIPAQHISGFPCPDHNLFLTNRCKNQNQNSCQCKSNSGKYDLTGSVCGIYIHQAISRLDHRNCTSP